jgi:hypothetical protein
MLHEKYKYGYLRRIGEKEVVLHFNVFSWKIYGEPGTLLS